MNEMEPWLGLCGWCGGEVNFLRGFCTLQHLHSDLVRLLSTGLS